MTLKDQIIETVMDAHIKIRQNMSRPVDQFLREQINPPDYMLMHLLEEEEGITMSEIASRMHISKQHATQMIERLVGEGLVSRETCLNDRRLIKIVLTNKGKSFLANCNNLVRRLIQLSFEDMSQEELKRLKEAIDVIIAFFSKDRSQMIKEIIDNQVENSGGFR